MRLPTRWQQAEAAFSAAVVATVGVVLAVSLSFDQRAGLFPWVVVTPTLALAAWQLVDDLRGKTRPPAPEPRDLALAEPTEAEAGSTRRRELALIGWILGLFAAVVLLGFPIGGALFTLIMLLVWARERTWICILYAVCVYLVLEVAFRQLLLIPFATGLVFEWVGFEPRINLRLLFRG